MKKINFIVFIFSLIILVGCNRNSYKSGRNISQATGWEVNNKSGDKNVGFQYEGFKKFKEPKFKPPGTEFIQGGTFTKGNVKDNVMHDWNNTPTQQYVRSFFMDKTEVTNVMYLEYLDWLKVKYYSNEDTKIIYEAALPDTLAWRNPLGFNEDMVNNYLRHPAYQNHPVVGVSWNQASNYAKWRTNRANEKILIDKGYLKDPKDSEDSDSLYYSDFNTKSYLFNPSNNKSNVDSLELPNGRYASVESGLLLPEYRLPTETEWEYAALGSNKAESNNYRGKKKFPFDSEYTRSQKKRSQGDILANFKLGRGDYGGIAGWPEGDGGGITSRVDEYPANDFGLYGMAGNVAEWVADVYRPIIDEDASDFNYYRGNVYTVINKDGTSADISFSDANKDTTWVRLPNGRIKLLERLPNELSEVSVDDKNLDRTNYAKSDNRNFNDGDIESTREYDKLKPKTAAPSDVVMYNESQSLIGNETRVYKGGSWVDRSYYLDPAQRRYYPEYMTTSFLGFRCAMSYLGSSRNNVKPKRR